MWMLSCFISSICPLLPFCITHHVQRYSFSTREGRKQDGYLDGRPKMMKKTLFWGVFQQFLMRLHETSLFFYLTLLRRSKTWAFKSILWLHYIWLGVISVEYLCKYIFIYFLFRFSYLSQRSFKSCFFSFLRNFSPFLQMWHPDKAELSKLWQVHWLSLSFQLTWKKMTSKLLKS